MKINEAIKFSDFYNEIKSGTMPLSLAYKFNKLMLEVEPQIKFYQERLNEYIELYAQRDENGNYIQSEQGIVIKPELVETCNKKIKELEEFSFDTTVVFSLNELGDTNMTPERLLPIMSLISE